MGTELSFHSDESVPQLTVAMVARLCGYTKNY